MNLVQKIHSACLEDHSVEFFENNPKLLAHLAALLNFRVAKELVSEGFPKQHYMPTRENFSKTKLFLVNFELFRPV